MGSEIYIHGTLHHIILPYVEMLAFNCSINMIFLTKITMFKTSVVLAKNTPPHNA